MQSNYIEWCNENEDRSYPLEEGTTQRALSGRQLPTDIIADMGILVPASYTDIYVSSVRVTPALYSVCLASGTAPLLVCAVPTAGYTPYEAVAMDPQVEDVTGWVVFGNHRTTVAEQYSFTDANASGLASRAVRVVDSLPVRRMLKYGGSTAQYIDRLVNLVGGNALRISRPDRRFEHHTGAGRQQV